MSKAKENTKRSAAASQEESKLRRGGAYRRFMAMTPAEREADVAKYDREMLEPGLPATKVDRALHRKALTRGKDATKRMGRPKIGKGSRIVPVTIEQGLLERADQYAKRHGLKRSQMVARGLKLVMDQPTSGAA